MYFTERWMFLFIIHFLNLHSGFCDQLRIQPDNPTSGHSSYLLEHRNSTSRSPGLHRLVDDDGRRLLDAVVLSQDSRVRSCLLRIQAHHLWAQSLCRPEHRCWLLRAGLCEVP